MLKYFLVFVFVYAAYRFIKNVKVVQKRQQKDQKTDYEKLDIQDAEYKEVNDDR